MPSVQETGKIRRSNGGERHGSTLGNIILRNLLAHDCETKASRPCTSNRERITFLCALDVTYKL